MARIRLRLELNPGGVGVRLDKLAKISTEFEKFLRLLAIDCGAESAPGDWVARQFYDSSFGSTVEYIENVDPVVSQKFNEGVRFFSHFNSDYIPTNYKPPTVRQFIELGDAIDSDERIKVGLFDDDRQAHPEWEDITRLAARQVDAVFTQEYRYEGALQGKPGTWYKDSNYFYLRDLSTAQLIKCFYRADMYDQVYRLFEDKDAVVNVTGMIVAHRATGDISEMRVTWAKTYPPLSKEEFNKLFGLAPDIIGDTSSADFIDMMRRKNGDDA